MANLLEGPDKQLKWNDGTYTGTCRNGRPIRAAVDRSIGGGRAGSSPGFDVDFYPDGGMTGFPRKISSAELVSDGVLFTVKRGERHGAFIRLVVAAA